MPNREDITVGIVGLGLIGGSIARALAEHHYPIIGIAHSNSTMEKAEKLEIFIKVSQNIVELNYCNVIFVATPINCMSITFQKLNGIIKVPCIVSDVASIKGEIVDSAQKIFDPERITFIGGHPMAGTELKGIDNSYSELFNACRWVLCPTDPRKSTQMELLSSIIQDTGATVIYANAQVHDKAAALISHMPLLVSMGLVEAANCQEDLILKELAFYLAAGGFRDTTRIAASNPELAYDMLKYNQHNVLKMLETFEQSLHNLKELLNSDKEDVIHKFEEIAGYRKQLYSEFGNNIFKGLSG